MGIRSEVGITVHVDLVESLEAACPWLVNEADVKEHEDGHKLYHFDCIKWYTETDTEIKALYKFFEDKDEEKFLILEACSEYPPVDGRSDSDKGDWVDNPWSMYRYVSVGLNIDE